MFGFLFRKVRKQKAEELISNALISIDSLVPMPRREDFSSDPLKIKAIDDFKNEYLSMLKTNRTIVSHDLMPKELHDYKNIYLDLLVSLCVEDGTDVNFDKINYSCDKSLDFELSIKRTKLMLYHSAVRDLTLEARLRLVALNELLEDNAFIKNRTFAILNEISNMRFSLFTFLSQQKAMEKEMINYFSDIINSQDQTPEEQRYSAINNRLKDLKEMAFLLIPEELKRLEMLRINCVVLIAKLEQLLEMFVYTHEEILEDLKKRVLKLHNKMIEIINEREPFSEEELKSEVRKLENMFKVFSLFSRNKVYKKDLELLYEVKFWLYTHDLSKIKPTSILNNATFTEVESYQDIIFKKIENILKGKNLNVLHLADSNHIWSSKVIGYISDVLKNGGSDYSAWDILNDVGLLSFLTAFDTYSGIVDFFNLPSSKQGLPKLNYYDEIFKWNDVMPLSTYCKIMRCNRKVEEENSNIVYDYDPIYEIYLLSRVYSQSKEEYRMPEGLREINIPINVMDTNYRPVIEYIRELASYRTVIMPSTLRRLLGNLFDKTVVNKIVLNRDLQEIKNYALLVHSLQELVIPGNSIDYSLNSIPFFQLHTLDITWRTNMLHDPKVIQNLYTVREVKIDDEGKYDVIDDDDIYPYQSQSGTAPAEYYVFSPNIVVLNVLDDDGTLIKSLKRDDITFVLKRHSKEQIESNEVGYLEANTICYGISKIIRECVQASRILKKE